MNVGSRYFESFLCCRVKSMTAKVSGIIHSSKVSGSNNFFKVGRSKLRLPLSPAQTSTPVIIKKKPTPPIHPMSICLGMKPTIYPNPKNPMMKNITPVRMLLSA